MKTFIDLEKRAVTLVFDTRVELDAHLASLAASMKTTAQASADITRDFPDPSESLEGG